VKSVAAVNHQAVLVLGLLLIAADQLAEAVALRRAVAAMQARSVRQPTNELK